MSAALREYLRAVLGIWWFWLGVLIAVSDTLERLVSCSPRFAPICQSLNAVPWPLVAFGLITVSQFLVFKRLRETRDALAAIVNRPFDVEMSFRGPGIVSDSGAYRWLVLLKGVRVVNKSPSYKVGLTFLMRVLLSGEVYSDPIEAQSSEKVPGRMPVPINLGPGGDVYEGTLFFDLPDGLFQVGTVPTVGRFRLIAHEVATGKQEEMEFSS